jgi:hypothetical protein
MDDVLFQRIRGNVNDMIDTHKSKYYRNGFLIAQSKLPPNAIIVDPFARGCKWATITNDINEEYETTYNLDAIDFMRLLDDNSVDLILFDPPFSASQQERKYNKGMTSIYAHPGYFKNMFIEIQRVLKSGGFVLQLGYNSTRYLKGSTLLEGWVVNFGGNRHDVIMTLWQKQNGDLRMWNN